MHRILTATAVLLLYTAAVEAQGEAPAPRVDHHQHLLSPTNAVAWSASALDRVALPPEFSRLVARRDSAFEDSAALAGLYTEDAVILAEQGAVPEFQRGRGAVAARVASLFGRPYRVTPVDVRMEGAAGHLAGYLTRGEADSPQHFGHILLALRREGDGAWRIAHETLSFPGLRAYRAIPADTLIELLNQAGIKRALVLSLGYDEADGPTEEDPGEYGRVRAENDWTGQQVGRFPGRLVGFCGVNPLRPWALEEIGRCDANPDLKGIKLHFGSSGVDLRDPAHVEAVRRVFRAANHRRMPIAAHLRSSFSREVPYGREAAETFLSRVLPAAPDIPVQIAHMGGSGPGWRDPAADSALAVFAAARAAGDKRTRNLWFDVASVVDLHVSPETAERLATRIRQIGVERVLYGSDLAVGDNLRPRQGWALVRGLLPLTDHEIRTIANNVAPYMR